MHYASINVNYRLMFLGIFKKNTYGNVELKFQIRGANQKEEGLTLVQTSLCPFTVPSLVNQKFNVAEL